MTSLSTGLASCLGYYHPKYHLLVESGAVEWPYTYYICGNGVSDFQDSIEELKILEDQIKQLEALREEESINQAEDIEKLDELIQSGRQILNSTKSTMIPSIPQVHGWKRSGSFDLKITLRPGVQFNPGFRIVLPLWIPTLFFSISTYYLGVYRRRLRFRFKNGLCLYCGYDLRFSEEVCSECGNAKPKC